MNLARITIASSILLVACHQQGELGELNFDLGITDVLYEFESGDRVLMGTHMCPWHEGINAQDQCYEEVLTGPAEFDADHCWTLDTPGEVSWEFNPTNLDGCNPEFSGDRMIVEVVAPSESLRLGFDDWRLRAPMAITRLWKIPHEVVGLEPGQTLEDLREDPGASHRVIAGQLDMPMLRLDDELGRIWFGKDGVGFEVVGQGATTMLSSIGSEFPGEQPVVLQPEAVAIIRAKLPGDVMLESPPLIAVPASAAASLDLVVMLGPDDLPAYAHARVRDAHGHVLHAAPIEWSVTEGALGVVRGDPSNEGRSGEYMLIRGSCEPPSSEPVERHAVLRARFATLEDTVELNWIEAAKAGGTEQPFEPDSTCMFGEGGGEG